MELIEIIKNTIFLLSLFGLGILTLSYSISKLRNRHKLESIAPIVKMPIPHSQPKKVEPARMIQNDQIRRSTSERFVVINELPAINNQKLSQIKRSRSIYHLQSIHNTGMHTLILN